MRDKERRYASPARNSKTLKKKSKVPARPITANSQKYKGERHKEEKLQLAAIHRRRLSVIISVVICTNIADPLKRHIQTALLLVYSAMISRLRPGCLRWQHSENADGRRQLESRRRQKVCLSEKKRRRTWRRETKRVKEIETKRQRRREEYRRRKNAG